MRVIVVGGGAAGFFAAISAKAHHPDAEILLIEKSDKLLAKVRISGGGRCNVTHHCLSNTRLAQHYPRGGRFLRKAFERFSVKDTISWFADRRVVLKTEADGRMFPETDDSATIVDCLMHEAKVLGVTIRMHCAMRTLQPHPQGGFLLDVGQGAPLFADKVIVTTGGHPKADGYAWAVALGHRIVDPVPSLFTFNMPEEPIRDLMGVVADPVQVRITGTDLVSTGPMLITHWGMSGPAILRLSAWGARTIHDLGYRFVLRVNWLNTMSEAALRETWHTSEALLGKRQAVNVNEFALPKRLWAFLLNKAGIAPTTIWSEVRSKERNRLIDLLTNDRYTVSGKTTFKEEFVTAGGIDLGEVDPMTMASRKCPGLYFAGEVLDIDGITGGFNFQAAWTTGFIAGQLG